MEAVASSIKNSSNSAEPGCDPRVTWYLLYFLLYTEIFPNQIDPVSAITRIPIIRVNRDRLKYWDLPPYRNVLTALDEIGLPLAS